MIKSISSSMNGNFILKKYRSSYLNNYKYFNILNIRFIFQQVKLLRIHF